jgi:hypothetical protein
MHGHLLSGQRAYAYFQNNTSMSIKSFIIPISHRIADGIYSRIPYLLCVAVISMPFPYIHVCALLEQLDGIANRPVLLATKEKTNDAAIRWLSLHRHRLNEQSVDSPAVMAMFHSVQRTDRDYGLDVERLERLIARALSLSRTLHDNLRLWREGTVHGDLGACVERVIKEMPQVSHPFHVIDACGLTVPQESESRATASKVTVEEIDLTLVSIAAHNPNSCPAVRDLATRVNSHDSIELLGKFYRSLGGKQAKWLTRFILKDYGAVKFPTRLDLSSQNAFLPRCIQMKAEVSIIEELPVLRQGTSFIYGTSSIGKPLPSNPVATAVVNVTSSVQSVANQLVTPSMAATERLRKKYNASRPPVSQLPTPLSKSPVIFSERLSRPPKAIQVITPPRTAPKPPSSVAATKLSHQVTSQPRTREPLAIVSTNIVSSQSIGPKSQEQPISLAPTAPAAATVRMTISGSFQISSSQPPAHRVSRTISHSPTKQIVTWKICGSGTCILTTARCPLVNCIFLLSPCLSHTPYIIENLLSWHGCRITTSLRAFADPSLPRHCPHTGKRYRKIALVEPNRTDQTVAFLKRIEGLNLQRKVRKGGEKVKEKQWVEAFDWRLLECIGKIDRGKEPGYNPWRRCWMGAV